MKNTQKTTRLKYLHFVDVENFHVNYNVMTLTTSELLETNCRLIGPVAEAISMSGMSSPSSSNACWRSSAGMFMISPVSHKHSATPSLTPIASTETIDCTRVASVFYINRNENKQLFFVNCYFLSL